MGFTTVPDKATGDVFTAAMWNTYIRDNFNTGVPIRIADTVLAADTASVTFAAIPQTRTHLKVVGSARTTQASVASGILTRFNGDSGANYDLEYLNGLAGVSSAGEAFGQTSEGYALAPGASAGASLFGGYELFIPNYSNASFNKSGLTITVAKYNTASGGIETRQVGWGWRSIAAITQIDLIANAASNFLTGTRFTLYAMP